MTGRELRAMRHGMGLSLVAFGRALGYRDNTNRNVAALMRRYERLGHHDVPPLVTIRAVDLKNRPANDVET